MAHDPGPGSGGAAQEDPPRLSRFERLVLRPTNRGDAFLFWAVLPVFALGIAIACAVQLPDAYRAEHGGGVPGTYVVTGRECGKFCSVTGDFTSYDGHVVARGIGYGAGEDLRVGDRAEVAYTDGDVYEPGGNSWVLFAVGGSVASAVFLLWATLLTRRLRRRAV